MRGIATGIVLRRLVARTIAQQYADSVLEATSPFQFALSTRAGVDCVALMTRVLTDLDEDAVVSSLDGVGAYDHVSRARFFEELAERADLAPMLPFVRLWYSRPSSYMWKDDAGVVHHIPQAEGVEQGDPLSPLLFSLAIHAALRRASEELQPGERLFAFLDDVYTVTSKGRAAVAAKLVADAIHDHAGVEPKLGKFQMWGRGGGAEPPGIDELLNGAPRPREPIWKGDLDAERNGIIVLGTPVGSEAFVQRFLRHRLADQSQLWDKLRGVPDLQSAWLLLLYCAVPRANHLLRAIPPDLVAGYAHAHDDGIWETFLDLIGYKRNRAASAQLSLDRAQSGEIEECNGEGAATYQRDFASETRALRDTSSAGATDPHRDSRSCCPAPAPAGPRAGSVESGALPASNESGEVLGTEVGGGDGSAAARGSIAGNLGPDPIAAAARKIAFLPLVHGGLGLRSSSLLAPTAH